jgi:hypothetical protein
MNYAFKAPIKPPTNHANMSPKQLNPTGATYGGTSIPVNAAPVGTTVPGNTYARSGYLSAKPKAWGFINRVEPDLPTYSSHDAWLRGLGREGMFNYAGHRNRVDIANGFKNAALRLPPFAQPVSPLYLDWQASQPFMNLWGN